MPSIDLNCDMGEGFGPWKMGDDAALMEYITSANIAAGFHAGDPTTIRKTVEAALAHGVALGVHPSYPDLQGFGRRSMSMKREDVTDILRYQISAVKGICESLGGHLRHVKPHGALYNDSAKDPVLAQTIAACIKSVDPHIILFGLSGSHSIIEAEKLGLRAASEVFSDRTYHSDGTLTPRSAPNALIRETEAVVAQVMQMIETQTVTAIDGKVFPIRAETICVHGDGPNAVEFTRAIRRHLEVKGIEVKSL